MQCSPLKLDTPLGYNQGDLETLTDQMDNVIARARNELSGGLNIGAEYRLRPARKYTLGIRTAVQFGQTAEGS
jgi:hypothetical protein